MHLTETQLNDLVDDALTPAERAPLIAHLEDCDSCAAEVARQRALLTRVAQLPRSIEPQRDLRPHIWAQTERASLWHWRYQLAAAAIVLIAISSLLTALLVGGNKDPEIRFGEVAQPVAVDLVSLEQQYSAEVEDLQRLLRQNRTQLAPETVRILEENLRIIDGAILEARAALARDPQSAALGEMLRSAYQRKLDLLKQAARSSAAT